MTEKDLLIVVTDQRDQALLRIARQITSNALDWDGESPFVDVRKTDFDALAAIVNNQEAGADQ